MHLSIANKRLKMQDQKMTDQMAGLENVRPGKYNSDLISMLINNNLTYKW